MNESHGYRNPWRPLYETYGVALWGAAAGLAWLSAPWWDLYTPAFLWFGGVAFCMAATWVPGWIRGINRRDWLAGRPIEFIAPERVVARLEQDPTQLWVGWGFEWLPKHAQEAMDLLRAGPERYAPRDPERIGATWLHGIGGRDQEAQIPLEHTEGHMLVVGTTGSGKAQPLTARVHTPEGWRAMGALCVGDRVSTPDGGSARVTGVYPQGVIPIYRVRFVDGRVVEACADHLWEIHHEHWHGRYRPGVSRAGATAPRVLSTRELMALLARDNGVLSVRLTAPVPKPQAELPVDPYVLGCLLGDGTLGQGTRLEFTSPTASIAERGQERLRAGRSVHRTGPIDYRRRGGGGRLPVGAWRAHQRRRALKKLGLATCRAWETHIPPCYKEASIEQRQALLQGLMDPDGSAGTRGGGTLTYATSSPRLAADVQELVWSLGGVARLTSRIPVYTYRRERRLGRRAYRVEIRHPGPREWFADAAKPDRNTSAYQYADVLRLRITGVDRASEAQAQCIAIDHPDHLYITDGYVVTHNTRLFDLLVTQAVCRGEAVIIIDPKGDRGLRASAERACALAGQPDRFRYFHPAFAADSIRINPMANYQRPSELATRIAALIPSETGNDPWKAFGQMALSHIVAAMVEVGDQPTILSLRGWLEGGLDVLVGRILTRWLTLNIQYWQDQAAPYLARARGAEQRTKRLLAYYRERVRPDYPSAIIDGLASQYEHEGVHFTKMIASLMPVLTMLTSASLETLLSPDSDVATDPRPIASLAEVLRRREVLYVGLDSLADGIVGGAIGSLLTADLAATAGSIYNQEHEPAPVNIFIDEAAEVVSDPMVQVLNKGRGAGLTLTIATQSFADFAARTGSQDKARQVLANVNNLIALRVLDGETQEYVAEALPEIRLLKLVQQQGAHTDGTQPLLFTGNVAERLDEEAAPLFPPALLGQLPNLEYVAKWAGGYVQKGRLPILGVPHASRAERVRRTGAQTGVSAPDPARDRAADALRTTAAAAQAQPGPEEAFTAAWDLPDDDDCGTGAPPNPREAA
jgi:conjugal transfer pilus assembly protein TraD